MRYWVVKRIPRSWQSWHEADCERSYQTCARLWTGVCSPIIRSCSPAFSLISIFALAHKVLVILYHILRTKKPYSDLGADYFDQQDRGRIERHHLHRLEQLGYTVTLTPKEAA